MANTTISQTTSGRATLCYGVYVETGDLAGRSIKELRDTYGGLWQMPEGVTAYKGKEQVSDDYIVQPGDRIEYYRKLGEKG